MCETTTLRPFHETILFSLRSCDLATDEEKVRILRLICQTRIPKGHDEILAAIDEVLSTLDIHKWSDTIRRTKESVLAQKKIAEEENPSKGMDGDLDDLQESARSMLTLLTERHPGAPAWVELFNKGLKKLHEATSRIVNQ